MKCDEAEPVGSDCQGSCEAGFLAALASGDLGCWQCVLCGEQHAYCGTALLACCIAAGCLPSDEEVDVDRLRGVANLAQQICGGWMEKGQNACSTCEGKLSTGEDVPAVPQIPEGAACRPDDPDTADDDASHAALCEACETLNNLLRKDD